MPRTTPLLLTALLLAGCGEATTSPVAPESSAPTAPAAAEATATEGPRFIAYDTPPRLTNSGEVARRMEQLYPAELKEAMVGGVVTVWLYIDEVGRVTDARVNRSSGVDELDTAGVTLARDMVFRPASHEGDPVAVWVSVPVSFAVNR